MNYQLGYQNSSQDPAGQKCALSADADDHNILCFHYLSPSFTSSIASNLHRLSHSPHPVHMVSSMRMVPSDVKCAIKDCRACEDGEIAKGVLDNIIENFEIADNENVPICQDTGMACVFLEIGQDVHLTGGDLREAVDEGVRRGYDKGYLRKSVVKDPVRRGNTAG